MTYIKQSWQCPICKRVYAPSVPMCFYCGDNTKITATCDTKSEESNSDTETNNDYKINTTNSKE